MSGYSVRRLVAALTARGRGVKQSSLPCRTKGDDGPHCSTAAILIVGLAIVTGIVAAPALDARAHDAPACPRWTGTADSLRAAVQDLIETFGPKYPQGAVCLARLEALTKAGARPGDRALEQLAAEALLANPLLDQLRLALVKRPNFGGHDGFFGYTSYVKRSPAELCVLESVRQGGPVRTLLRTETGCVRDPDVSFDGRRVLFAYARDEHDDYHLYEIQADGSGMRQLTTSPPYTGPEPTVRGTGCQDVEPCYLPSGEIAFTSTRYVRFVDCVDVEPVTTLFVMDGDGRHLRGISANHVHDWHPAVLGDGRRIYTRWEYTDRSQMWPHKLFVKNPDGSGTGGHSCPVSALGGSWHVKRILGTVPVHADGSAAFRIPAERRVFFQPLDEHGRALQSMRSWVEAMPGERITCIGCHESPSEPPPVAEAAALARVPVDSTPWYGPARAFSFVREVQPVLNRHCVRCHNAADKQGLDLRGDATNWFSLAYENLRPFVEPSRPQGSAALPAPRSRGAAASRLVDALLAGHEDVRLDRESLDRIITWIDLNVPYYDNTAITRPATVPLGNAFTASGRAVIGDPKPLWDALGNDCRGCHARGFSVEPVAAPCQVLDLPKTLRRPPVNLTHPEESRILTAPLARTAGGLELCGKPVWTGRDAPAYQAALRVIQAWHDDLVAHPREDMPGSVPCPAYTATQSKRQAWLQIEAANRRE